MEARSRRGATTSVRREALRALQHDLSRTQLLDAAEVVFGEKGLHATTIKEIAELAEYSVGSVYSYFSGKDELLTAVMVRRGHEMIVGIERVVAGDDPALRRLVDLARFEVRFFAERPHFARLYLRVSAIGPLVPDSVDPDDLTLERAMSLTAALIAQGQAQGDIVHGPPRVLGRLLSGIVTAYQAIATSSQADELDRYDVDHLAALIERTFAASPAAPVRADDRRPGRPAPTGGTTHER